MAKKRIRNPVAKAGELKIGWGRESPGDTPDLQFAWGPGVSKSDSHLLHTVLGTDRFFPSMANFPGYEKEHSLFDELEARGYDLSTLKFSIQKKVDPK